MSDIELDNLYTELCHTMGGLGERRSPLFLARFALLAMGAIGQADVVQGLLRDASDGLAESA